MIAFRLAPFFKATKTQLRFGLMEVSAHLAFPFNLTSYHFESNRAWLNILFRTMANWILVWPGRTDTRAWVPPTMCRIATKEQVGK